MAPSDGPEDPAAPGTGDPRIDPDWLHAGATRRVMEALGGEAWFVGGCVRNALMDRPATDVDLATPLVPDEVTDRLKAAKLRAIPTGFEHGTVTAVAEGQPFEITTFRSDVETDGRRATVAFTTEMGEDASRRDFTINALYADAAGLVVDPVGGLPDIAAGRVRFIGAPDRRIAEDRLRILRFYRFTAWYARGGIDADGRAACAAGAAGMGMLARERIGAEMRKLLAAPDPCAAVEAMAEDGVLDRCLPGHGLPGALARLVALEAGAGVAPDWRTRLAALVPSADPETLDLRLSRAEVRAVSRIEALAAGGLGAAAMAEEAGPELARAAILLRAARSGEGVPDGLEADLAHGSAAVFPVGAADLMAAGVPKGPALGAALARARELWRDSGFRLDRSALVAAVVNKGQQGCH